MPKLSRIKRKGARKMAISNIQHGASLLGKAVSELPKKPTEESHPDPLKRYAALKKYWALKDKLSGDKGYQSGKGFEKAEKKMIEKLCEPQRKNFPKGTLGDIRYKRAYTKWLEEIT